MKEFYVKQKLWRLKDKFTVMDNGENPVYQVEGSFFTWLKHFDIRDMSGGLVSHIDQEFAFFLPRFRVTLANGQRFTIQKEFSWFKPRYQISDLGLTVQGDFWDMDYCLYQNEVEIARISQEWFRIRDTYQVMVFEDCYEHLVISLVLAIDFVKALEQNH